MGGEGWEKILKLNNRGTIIRYSRVVNAAENVYRFAPKGISSASRPQAAN